MNNRQDYFDFAKGMSIIFVVVFHSTIALHDYNLAHSKYWLINNFMGPIRMPVFFFISGVLAKGALKSFNEGKFSAKVCSFIYLFAVWTLIHLTWRVISPASPMPEVKEWITPAYSPSSVLWFIWALAIYFCVARSSWLLRKEAIFSLSLLFSLMTCAGVIEFENYVHNNLLVFLPIFLFGAWYSDNLVRSPVFLHPLSFPISLLVFITLFIPIYRGNIPDAWEGVVAFIMMALGVVVGLATSAFLCRFATLSTIPIFIGKNTLAIYLSHSPIVGFLAASIALSSSDATLTLLLGVPLVSIVSVFMALKLKTFLERMGLWWLYKLPVKPKAQAAS